MQSWDFYISEAVENFRKLAIEQPEIDARRIMERASGISPNEYFLEIKNVPTQRAMHFFDAMVARRTIGEPLQYVVGQWSFRELEIFIDHRVLIPRPETEIVVSYALEEIDHAVNQQNNKPPKSFNIVELGTGSGVIALSLALERNFTEVWATDISQDALHVAQANLVGIGTAARRVHLVEGNWFAPLEEFPLKGNLHMVISNPPYIYREEELPPQVKNWEPHLALFAEDNGREAIRHILVEAFEWIVPGGVVVIEIGFDQGSWVLEFAQTIGYKDISVKKDYTHKDRCVIARK